MWRGKSRSWRAIEGSVFWVHSQMILQRGYHRSPELEPNPVLRRDSSNILINCCARCTVFRTPSSVFRINCCLWSFCSLSEHRYCRVIVDPSSSFQPWQGTLITMAGVKTLDTVTTTVRSGRRRLVLGFFRNSRKYELVVKICTGSVVFAFRICHYYQMCI